MFCWEVVSWGWRIWMSTFVRKSKTIDNISCMELKALIETIIELKQKDLELRARLIQNGQLCKGYNEEMSKLHSSNAKKLNEIIDSIGYPTIDKVGNEASEAAWLVIQHSIGHPEFMKKCANLLKIAVAENKANPIHLAYLTDRIAVFEEQPQCYGTQFDWDENGNMSPKNFDNLDKVNQRRKSIGLNTLEEQTKIIRAQIKKENQTPPSVFEKRKKEFDDWRKSVGWKKR